MNIYWESISTEKGDIIVMATDEGILWVGTPGASFDYGATKVRKFFRKDISFVREQNAVLKKAIAELKAYLRGEKVTFTGPFILHGTSFQKAVWRAIADIPYGSVVTYKQIATQVKSPQAVRAVGAGCGANPVAIMIPCHRVVGSNTSLTGYGGGLPTKQWLLALERVDGYTH